MKSRPRALIRLALFFALLAGDRALGQEGVTLAPRFEPEGKWFVSATTRFELDLATEDPEGKRSAQSLVQARQDKYTREFVAVENGVPTRQRIAYLVSTESVSRDPTLPPEKTATELENREFQVALQEDGPVVSCVGATVSERSLQQVQARERCLALLPPRPVSPNESWNVEGVDAGRFLVETYSIIPGPDSSLYCTLKELREEGESTVAEIAISINLKGKSRSEAESGFDFSLSMAGRMLFDVSRGMPQSLTLDGTMQISGAKTGKQGETLLKVDGTGTIKLELEFE